MAESAIKAHRLAGGLLGDPGKEMVFGGHLHLSARLSWRSLFWMDGALSGHELN